MIYVVERGDTLYSIAGRFAVPAEKIAFDNQIVNPEKLAVGQALLILAPGEEGEYRDGLQVSGYAYTFVEPYILEQAFPAINQMLVFSYGFTFEGELIPPIQDDLWMIEAAWKNGIEPLLVLTPFSEGTFSNQLIKVLVENKEIQNHLIENVLATVEEKGYAGVDIDFEYILPENRVPYAEFVGNMRNALYPRGYQTTVAIPPKTDAQQKGLLYEGIDYQMLGENADYVFLMTYEWGYAYSEPMAVAPLNKVRQVIEYALTEIPKEKIMMGIPNYGYDWTLPYEKGVTKAIVVGNVEAANLAAEKGAAIQFSEIAQSPSFLYESEEKSHEVWFEDVRSIAAKLELAKEYRLRGVGYWNLMRPFRANWLMLYDKS